jgi:hypothetical protein
MGQVSTSHDRVIDRWLERFVGNDVRLFAMMAVRLQGGIAVGYEVEVDRRKGEYQPFANFEDALSFALMLSEKQRAGPSYAMRREVKEAGFVVAHKPEVLQTIRSAMDL